MGKTVASFKSINSDVKHSITPLFTVNRFHIKPHVCFSIPSICLVRLQISQELVVYWWLSALLQLQITAEEAQCVAPTLNGAVVLLQAAFLLSAPKPVCVSWERANLPGWLHWPQAIDCSLSRLECHLNTGGDHSLPPGSAFIPLCSNHSRLFSSLCSFMWKICLCSCSKQKRTCFGDQMI